MQKYVPKYFMCLLARVDDFRDTKVLATFLRGSVVRY